mgnify:CR=1 FL=1
MNTVIFRTLAPLIVAIMLVFSVYVTLRGHNEPGGGFIGGLIAAASIAVFGLSGLASLLTGSPFMTSIWLYLEFGPSIIPLSTPLFFDLGVYCVVFGTLSAIALSLESDREEDL